jgi:hypothetical protein
LEPVDRVVDALVAAAETGKVGERVIARIASSPPARPLREGLLSIRNRWQSAWSGFFPYARRQ